MKSDILALSFVCLFSVLVSCSRSTIKNSQSNSGTYNSHSTKVGGEKRSYFVYKPKVAETEKNSLPILFMFHGSRSSGKSFSNGTNFNSIAEREKFITVYPDALVGNWAEGCGCNNADRLKVKDLEFVKKMIDELRQDYAVDTSNIFVVGFSQGGLFVDRLACERTDVLRGAVVVAANMSVPLSKSCMPGRAIPMTFIQGTHDSILKYDGVQNGSLSLLSAKNTAKFWAAKNGLDSEPATSYLPDAGNPKVEVVKYRGEKANEEVTLFSLKGFGHDWAILDYFNTNEEIAKFVSKHRVP